MRDENTLVLFTSDNGPWIEKHLAGEGGIDAYYGCADPLRGSKMMTWDGGERVPCLVRWPKHVPAGKTSGEIVSTLDVLPTFAALAGTQPPQDRTLDGMNVSEFLLGRGDRSGREVFYFYCYTHLQAVRCGKWKLVLPRPARPPWCGWSARMVDAVEDLSLYDLETDIEEKHNVAGKNPDVVDRLMKLVASAREDLGDYDRVGKGARFWDEGPRRPDATRRKDGGEGKTPGKKGKGKPAAQETAEYDNAPPAGNLRFDFESGDMQGWRVVEGDLPGAWCDRDDFYLRYRINRQGKGLLNTIGRGKSDKPNDTLTGVIESPIFRQDGPKMSFLVGGGDGPDTYVALCDAGDGKELLQARGAGGWKMQRVQWDVEKFKGRQLFLRIVDRSRGGWGHVTFDDFSAEGVVDAEATAARWKAIFKTEK